MARIDTRSFGGSSDPADDDDDSSSSSSITSISSSSRRAFAGSSSSSDDETETVSVDPNTQTLEEMVGEKESSTSDDPAVEVQSTDHDASSPSGGAGATSAAARFTGQDEADVDDPIAETQEASNEFTTRMRLARRAGLDIDPAEAVGSIFDDQSALESQATAIETAAMEKLDIDVSEQSNLAIVAGAVAAVVGLGAIVLGGGQ